MVTRSFPRLVEATLVPTALFYLMWYTLGRWGAFVAALAWAYGALARRLALRRGVPGLLVLALVGLTVRTVLALATGSTFIYFVQPVLSTCAVAATFLLSALTARPLVARLAADFYPLPPPTAARHSVRRLFRRLTLLWAGVNLINAAVAFVLLVTLPVAVFVATKTVAVLAVTLGGVALTVHWSLRVARTEGLIASA